MTNLQDRQLVKEQPVKIIPTLPSLSTVSHTLPDSREILIQGFFERKTLRSLTHQEPAARLPKLCKSVALAVSGQYLLPEERELVLYFLANKSFDLLQIFVYQKLMHGYLQSPDYYR